MTIDWYKVMQAISPAIQTILVTLITVLLTAAGYYARRVALQWEAKLRAGLSAEQWDLAVRVGRSFVLAAEELYASGEGAAKLAWVEDMTAAQLAQYGIDIDTNALEGAIHGVLYDEIQQWKEEREGQVRTPVRANPVPDPTFDNWSTAAGPPKA